MFHNIQTQEGVAAPHGFQLLPLDPASLQTLQRRQGRGRALPIYTMATDDLFSSLVRQHLFVTLYRAGAESMASEHATRLAAMQAAERNIKEHLEEMNTDYRRRRQQSITEELLDVVADPAAEPVWRNHAASATFKAYTRRYPDRNPPRRLRRFRARRPLTEGLAVSSPDRGTLPRRRRHDG